MTSIIQNNILLNSEVAMIWWTTETCLGPNKPNFSDGGMKYAVMSQDMEEAAIL